MTAALYVLTLDELLALVRAVAGFYFLDYMYAPDGSEGAIWTCRIFYEADNDRAAQGLGDTIEEATFMAWCDALEKVTAEDV